MGKLEKDIENKFVEECLKLGVNARKLSTPGEKGFPDRTVFLPNGRVFLVEFKKPGGKTSKHQDETIEELISLGHIVMVCDNYKDPLLVVKRLVRMVV